MPDISFVISTYNRRDVLLHTLGRLDECGLAREAFETIIVDNASTDRTADTIEAQFPAARVIRMRDNRGSCAKNAGVRVARGRFVVFLDDDSYPLPGSAERMMGHFDAAPGLGAAVFQVVLRDGSRECSAYPDVFIGCGTGFRREALIETGGLPGDFFMQAEEYDLSLRLLQGGWDIRAFDDLIVEHLKTPTARRSWRTMRLDVRNNLTLAMRYMPGRWGRALALDWMKRYYHIAAARQQRSAFFAGCLQGALRSLDPSGRRPVSGDVFERFARIDQIKAQLRRAVDRFSIRSVVFVDYGKNILPYALAAEQCGVEVVAIAEPRLAGSCHYRGVPVVNDAVARRLGFDAVIVSNSSPVHARLRCAAWRGLDDRPVLDLLDADPIAAAESHLRKQTGLAA